MAGTNERVLSISLPTELAEQIEKQAEREGRSISELLHEAFRSYEVRRVLENANERFRKSNFMGYTEADVERLIDEYRAEERSAAERR